MPMQPGGEDELHRKILSYVDANLGGVDPPDAASAAAGTMVADPPAADQPPPTVKPQPMDLGQPIGWSDSGPPSVGRSRVVQRDSGPDVNFSAAQRSDESSKAMGKLGQAVTAMGERPTNFADFAIGLGRGGKSEPMKHSTLWDDQAANGDGAVAKLQGQRKADADLASQAAAKQKAASAKDPNSETAQTYRTVLAKFAPDLAPQLASATPEQMERIAPWLEKYANENQTALKNKAATEEAARKATLHDKERGEDLENRKLNHADSNAIAESNNAIAKASLGLRTGSDARDAAKDARDIAEKAKGHPTSPSTLTELADATTAIDSLGSLGAKFKGLNMSGTEAKFSSKATDLLDLQGTDAAEYKAAALRAMQGVGKILEGGKLAAGDEVKYRQMLPRPGDDERIADQKIKDSQAFLRTLVDQRVKTLRGAGYNVPDINGPAPAAGTKTVGGVTYEKRPDGKWYPVGGQ